MSWLELVDETGRLLARRDARALPCSVGRAHGNALVTSDPYVDPHHAEVALDDAGRLVVRDLGSVNGLRRPDDDARHDLLPLEPGQDVMLGRSRLRLVTDAPAEALPPARRPAPEPAGPRWLAVTRRRAVQLAAAATLTAVGAVVATIGLPERPTGMVASAAAVGILLLVVVWTAGWALATRLRRGESRFGSHFVVAVVATLVSALVSEVPGWADFLLPDSPVVTALLFGAAAVSWFVALVLHLRVMTPGGGTRTGRAALVAALVLAAVGTWLPTAMERDFSTVATIAGTLKPLPASLIPARTPAQFAESLDGLERELLDDEEPAPTGTRVLRRADDDGGAPSPESPPPEP